MRNRFTVAVALTTIGLLSLVGCGSSSTTSITDTVTPSGQLLIDAGQSISFKASVKGDSSNSGVTWQLLDNSGGSLTQITSTSATFVAPTTWTGSSTSYISIVSAIPVKNTQTAATASLTVYPALQATAPTLSAGRVAAAYSYQFASTGGASTKTWAITSGALPAGLTLSTSGLLSGTPTASGNFSFAVTVTDSATTQASITLFETLTVAAANLAITTAAVPDALQGQSYSTTLASQYGTAPVTWALANSTTLPAGLTLNANGTISGVPTSAGAVTFQVKATDSSPTPLTATATFTLNVYAPLAITTTTLPNGSVQDAYSQQLVSTGGKSPVTWKLTAGTLPAGLTLSTAGLISGTPTAATSNANITVQATDSYGVPQTATQTLSITIVLSTLQITTTSVPSGTTGLAYSSTLTSTGGHAPITWALQSGSSLPPGLQLSNTGVISGTPTTTGNYSFTVTATDTIPATVSATFTIKVVAPSTLKITTTSVPNGNIGTAYSATVSATLGTAPYTWSLTSGALPQGLTFSAAGVISGTTYVAGSYNFTVQVTDATGASVTQALKLNIGTTISGGTNNSLLSGSYAFLVNGRLGGASAGDGKSYGFATIGSFNADGAGNVTGVADINNATGVQTAQALSGTYAIGSDGRGLVSLTAGSTTTVYVLALSSQASGIAQYAALTEFDNSTGTGAQASGYALAQTSSAFTAATIKGPFVFGLTGETQCSTCGSSIKYGPVVAVGLFTGDGAAAIASGGEDVSTYGGGTYNYSALAMTGTFTSPATTTGRGTLKFTYTGTQMAGAPVNYTYVMVNANTILLMSNDSHATSVLLSGDAHLQTTTTYTAATAFTGTSIGVESQAAGGDASKTYPDSLNAIVTAFNNTSSGNATLLSDENKAGVVSTAQSRGVSYTVSANGRTYVTSGSALQTIYLYSPGTGFGIDLSTTTTYPALIRYTQLAPNTTAQEPLLSGTLAAATVATPVIATMSSGTSTWGFHSGGVNSGGILGTIASTTDTSTPAGLLTGGITTNANYSESTTSRILVYDSNNALTGMGYVISGTQSVIIPTSASTTPTVTVYQK